MIKDSNYNNTDKIKTEGEKKAIETAIETDIAVNREHKDRVFRLLFNNRKNLLELYNALNQTGYTNEDDLTINTLDNAIFMSMKNDISFILGSDMCLYEHQSTICPNMPLRGLFYISELYRKTKDEKYLYSTTLIKIPTPHYIVFYNGEGNTGDITVQRLSDAFLNKDREGCIEVTATMININYGHNKTLMENCRTLQDYSYFISRVRFHMSKVKDKNNKKEKYDAVNASIDECIRQNVLVEFLSSHRREVANMSIYEYDEEEAKKVFREDGRIEGILETKISVIFELLEDKGELPQSLKEKISTETDLDILTKWLKSAAKADSIDEFGKLIEQ